MPLAATQEGEASGSRAPARRRGRCSTTAVAAALRRGRSSATAASAAAMPATTARSVALVRARRQSSGSQSAQRKKRRRRAGSNKRPSKRKRTSEEEEEEVSSAGSSPIRVPHIPDEVYRRGLDDPDTWKTIQKAQADYDAKLARRMTYPTLNVHMIRASMCVLDDPELVPDHESARKAVLHAAQSVVGISSSVGGKPLARGCGFWIDWDKKNKMGTFLTTSRLICTESPSFNCWLGQEEYDLDAEVLVHLQGDITEKAHLQYLQKHYDLAFFSVKVDQPVYIPSFNDGVKRANKVFELGRDESSFLRISYGVVKYLNPNLFERYHYMFVQGADPQPEYGNGGPLIDFDGKIVGMVNGNTRGSFIPSSILVKCLHLWKKFQRIPRPHLGMKFWSIEFIDLALSENILRMCNIDDGLIVKEVSEGSPAEKLGIRAGDVIKCFNGERISTTVELENMLLSKCEDESDNLNSEVDVELEVFHIRKFLWRNRTLTVNVSDDGEVVDPGVRYPFGKGTSVSSVSPSEPSEKPGSIPCHLTEQTEGDTMVDTESPAYC
ncbi:uncharacterized protein LOC124646726 [Lolium rigidum]|uniref:uncharacterized protein LOC124646726 n=1 Tax=Lolium rigidum TaxID=89674 RepID=UPI001F5C6A82|nr:uncharacterized protein LOC124646726 [Lolium rigidum]